MGHIKGILQGAVRIARVMEQGNSVVVHCSDGWDRTPQLTGMAQIMMDSYFRTLRGFITLVDKEWCSFGHKFADRCLVASDTNSEWSPIFMQFLDCVYQMYAQYPTHFEFSSKLLVFLCDETYAGRFGTFMCNSEKERLDQRLHVKTISVWTYVMGCEETFQNPLFDKETLQGIYDCEVFSRSLLFVKRQLFFDFPLSSVCSFDAAAIHGPAQDGNLEGLLPALFVRDLGPFLIIWTRRETRSHTDQVNNKKTTRILLVGESVDFHSASWTDTFAIPLSSFYCISSERVTCSQHSVCSGEFGIHG